MLAVLQARNAELEFQLQEYQVRLQQKEEQHSEARLTDIFNRAIASIASLRMSSHQTWEYDYLSSGCEVVFGYSSQAFMTNPTLWLSRVLPEDRDAVTTTRNMIFSTGSAAIEYRFCHADGTVRWISETLSSHWDEVADCGVVTVVSLDVSAHKRTEAEREQRVESESVAYNSIGVSVELAKTISDRRLAEVTLRQSEQRMRSILSSISDAFFSVDREWRFTFLNQQAERVLRRDAQQLLGNTVWESFPDAVDSAFYHQYHWAMEHQQSVSFEAYYPPYDLWVDVRAYPFAAGLTVYFLDITERKQVELEARRLQERLQFLLANTPAAIFTCKPNGDFGATFISDNIQTISGHEPQEFLTESGFWISHLHPDDLNRIISEMPLLFNEGHHTYEYRFRHKDGSYRWVRDSLRLIRDALGEPVEIVGCVTDISDRKQAEISLRESEQRLQTILESSPLSI
ncbi:PAS domain-containing protein, partial [Leptolyngbya sp. FACHB-36]|uniref:PAS domain-containing protein n=1 Tax=Leptolyngbya sp. FACHB-36 TaxID=2692808 RepID=UPI0016800BD7